MSADNTTWLRFLADLILAVLILVAPWWLYLLGGLVLLFLFENYYELVVAGFIVDVLYGVPLLLGDIEINFTFTLTAFVIFLVALPLKSRLVFYR